MGLSQADIEKAKDDLLAESSRDRTSVNRFVGKTDSVEDTLKLQTMGLQKLEDFTAKKRALEEQRQREAAQTAELEKEERKKLKKNLKKGKKAKLSFADDDEEEVKGELHSVELCVGVYRSYAQTKDRANEPSWARILLSILLSYLIENVKKLNGELVKSCDKNGSGVRKKSRARLSTLYSHIGMEVVIGKMWMCVFYICSVGLAKLSSVQEGLHYSAILGKGKGSLPRNQRCQRGQSHVYCEPTVS